MEMMKIWFEPTWPPLSDSRRLRHGQVLGQLLSGRSNKELFAIAISESPNMQAAEARLIRKTAREARKRRRAPELSSDWSDFENDEAHGGECGVDAPNALLSLATRGEATPTHERDDAETDSFGQPPATRKSKRWAGGGSSRPVAGRLPMGQVLSNCRAMLPAGSAACADGEDVACGRPCGSRASRSRRDRAHRLALLKPGGGGVHLVNTGAPGLVSRVGGRRRPEEYAQSKRRLMRHRRHDHVRPFLPPPTRAAATPRRDGAADAAAPNTAAAATVAEIAAAPPSPSRPPAARRRGWPPPRRRAAAQAPRSRADRARCARAAPPRPRRRRAAAHPAARPGARDSIEARSRRARCGRSALAPVLPTSCARPLPVVVGAQPASSPTCSSPPPRGGRARRRRCTRRAGARRAAGDGPARDDLARSRRAVDRARAADAHRRERARRARRAAEARDVERRARDRVAHVLRRVLGEVGHAHAVAALVLGRTPGRRSRRTGCSPTGCRARRATRESTRTRRHAAAVQAGTAALPQLSIAWIESSIGGPLGASPCSARDTRGSCRAEIAPCAQQDPQYCGVLVAVGRAGTAARPARAAARRPSSTRAAARAMSRRSGRPEQRGVAIRRHLAQLAAEGEPWSRREQQYREGREHGAIYLRRALAWNKPARARALVHHGHGTTCARLAADLRSGPHPLAEEHARRPRPAGALPARLVRDVCGTPREGLHGGVLSGRRRERRRRLLRREGKGVLRRRLQAGRGRPRVLQGGRGYRTHHVLRAVRRGGRLSQRAGR